MIKGCALVLLPFGQYFVWKTLLAEFATDIGALRYLAMRALPRECAILCCKNAYGT